jgi:hypothetical protein
MPGVNGTITTFHTVSLLVEDQDREGWKVVVGLGATRKYPAHAAIGLQGKVQCLRSKKGEGF